jgi:DivIVA domain-containing protein
VPALHGPGPGPTARAGRDPPSPPCHHQGVGTVLGYILALLVVGGVLFLAASFAFGRGEEMAPVLPEGTPVELPDDRLARGDDLRALKLSVALRGYRMDEVDWLLDRLSEQVDRRDREIARLRSVLHVEPVSAGGEPELLTHPVPAVRDLGAGERAEDRPRPVLEPAEDGAAGQRGPRRGPEDGADATSGWRPRRLPEGAEATDARPDRPARDIRTTAQDTE